MEWLHYLSKIYIPFEWTNINNVKIWVITTLIVWVFMIICFAYCLYIQCNNFISNDMLDFIVNCKVLNELKRRAHETVVESAPISFFFSNLFRCTLFNMYSIQVSGNCFLKISTLVFQLIYVQYVFWHLQHMFSIILFGWSNLRINRTKQQSETRLNNKIRCWNYKYFLDGSKFNQT